MQRRLLGFYILAIAVFMVGSSDVAYGQGCPAQVCQLAGSCYGCNGTQSKEGCSVKVSDCTECTNWICDQKPPKEEEISKLLDQNLRKEVAEFLRESCRKLGVAVVSLGAQKDLESGTKVSLARTQIDGPAVLISATFGVRDLLLRGQLFNQSKQPVVEYQLGWVYLYPDRNPQVVLGKAFPVPEGIQPGRLHSVPAQGASPEPTRRGARAVKFFVARVRFSDGSEWKEKTSNLRKLGVESDPTEEKSGLVRRM
jgi:hypothetical protein